MSDTTTTHYGWVVPENGGSNNTFGLKVNQDLEDIDDVVFTVSQAADAAQAAADAAQDTADAALAGGGAIVPTAITLAGGDPYTGTVDLDLNSVFSITQTNTFTASDCNLTFANRPATEDRIIYLRFAITGSGGITSHDFTVKFNSTQKVWALPMQVEVVNSGSSLSVVTLEPDTSSIVRYVVPVYIIAGV